MQKVCETIGLFNAEYLAMSDISINTHTHTHTHTISATGADYIINIRADVRKYTAFFAFLQGRPHCFFIPFRRERWRHAELNIYLG